MKIAEVEALVLGVDGRGRVLDPHQQAGHPAEHVRKRLDEADRATATDQHRLPAVTLVQGSQRGLERRTLGLGRPPGRGTDDARRDLRRVEYGDERDPEQRAKLTAISPLTRAREIKIPLLVVTGANDPRVPASEADQIIAAVRAQGGQAWHLLGQNEGHGFAKKENADYQFWASLLFWKQTLLAE